MINNIQLLHNMLLNSIKHIRANNMRKESLFTKKTSENWKISKILLLEWTNSQIGLTNKLKVFLYLLRIIKLKNLTLLKQKLIIKNTNSFRKPFSVRLEIKERSNINKRSRWMWFMLDIFISRHNVIILGKK